MVTGQRLDELIEVGTGALLEQHGDMYVGQPQRFDVTLFVGQRILGIGQSQVDDHFNAGMGKQCELMLRWLSASGCLLPEPTEVADLRDIWIFHGSV